jgi:esterase/lipase superfamily enzyme
VPLLGGSAGREFKVIRIFYATDRQQTGNSQARKFFANDRAPNGTLSLGVCEVSIPDSDRHKLGFLEKPSIYRLEFRPNPKKHVVLLSAHSLEERRFFNLLKRRVAKSERKEAFVFIHGYNVTFEDAARRTAQFASDLQFDGAPVLYSRPSRGS